LKLYETTFITDSRQPESEIETEIKRVEETITSNGGEIVETQRWGVRRLAYEIEKQKQGYYAHFLYKSESEVPSKLETGFRVNEKIMRFLTVVSEIDLEERKRRIEAGEPATPTIEFEDRRRRRFEEEDDDRDDRRRRRPRRDFEDEG
jgi:small subunit ribosomal protein S6